MGFTTMMVSSPCRCFLASILLLLLVSTRHLATATISCVPEDPALGDALCVQKYREGSVCRPIPSSDSSDGGQENDEGICSNPYLSGCLRAYLGEEAFAKKRTCNSDDDEGAAGRGECEDSPFGYEEVRILSSGWESAMFTSWIMQIILSEILGVPTTMETSMPDPESSFNFYDPELRFSPSKPYDYTSLETGMEYGDCRLVRELSTGDSTYRSCAHVMPEAWNGQKERIDEVESKGIIEPSTGTGGVGKLSWYIPKFTAERDPMFLSHFGLSTHGKDELAIRRKIAETFLPPQTWKWFCDNVSADSCATPYYDDEGLLIAARAPIDESEEVKYFSPGSFHGHFATTADQDCDANPFECTGHLTSPRCYWTIFTIPQAHYHGIPVKSSGPHVAGGYDYSSVQEIWNAANYTKSDVLYYWYSPTPLMQNYLGTEAEFQRILFPPPTEECVQSRVTIDQRCSENPEDHIGTVEGACDVEAHSYQKLIVSNMYDRTYAVEEASRSPAYDAIKNIKVSDIEVEEIFRWWYQRNVDEFSFDSREAVCRWVAENLSALEHFVPRSYPRSMSISQYYVPALYGAMVIAAVAIVLVGLTCAATWLYRKTKVMVYAQPDFLFMLLGGLLFVCSGAILYATTPSDFTCMARHWFVVLGYSLETVPLIVKVAAINRLMLKTSNFKRVEIDRKKLYITVGAIVGVVVLYLAVWTGVDPSTRQTTKTLTDEENDDGGQVVAINYSCASKSPAWIVVAYIYQFLLLIAATILAFQSRKVRSEFNESTRLSFVIYTNFLFIVLRALIWIFQFSLDANIAAAVTSYLLSADSIANLGIYFVPKIKSARLAKKDYQERGSSNLYSSSRHASTHGSHMKSLRSSTSSGAVCSSCGLACSYCGPRTPVQPGASPSTKTTESVPECCIPEPRASPDTTTLESVPESVESCESP